MKRSANLLQKANMGFTLVELLAATSILVLLVMLLAQLFMQTSTMWDRGTSRTDMNTMARAALNLMQRELEVAIISDDIAMRVNDDRIFFVSLVGNLSDPSTYERGTVELGYYVDLTRDLNGNAIPDRFSLYRAANTQNLNFLRDSDWWNVTWASPGAWSPGDELIVKNVHSVEFTYWYFDPANVLVDRATIDTSVEDIPPPALIEITLTLVNEDTALRWEALTPEQRAAGMYVFNSQVRIRTSSQAF